MSGKHLAAIKTMPVKTGGRCKVFWNPWGVAKPCKVTKGKHACLGNRRHPGSHVCLCGNEFKT